MTGLPGREIALAILSVTATLLLLACSSRLRGIGYENDSPNERSPVQVQEWHTPR